MTKEDTPLKSICQIFAARDHGAGVQLAHMQHNIQTWINEKVVSKDGKVTHIAQSLASENGIPLVVVTVLAEIP
ncbi:MAG: hypothetical protein QGG26_16965 [Candidatus Undinarchaeales archaeon]|nr:hypothetical protein [Candidatus Undinarchaeales archaeon]